MKLSTYQVTSALYEVLGQKDALNIHLFGSYFEAATFLANDCDVVIEHAGSIELTRTIRRKIEENRHELEGKIGTPIHVFVISRHERTDFFKRVSDHGRRLSR